METLGNVIITGSASGMGLATAKLFVERGWTVFGIDVKGCPQEFLSSENYFHRVADVCDKDSLPVLSDANILINSAGVQGTDKDIDVNLKGVINCCEKYALGNMNIESVINQASLSATLGTDFPQYVASKGGVISYTKWVAKEIAKYGATCNSLSFSGVLTEANRPVIESSELWAQVMELTPLQKWTTVKEVAEWVYFMTTVNKSCSGQDIIIDNLESLNGVFVWA